MTIVWTGVSLFRLFGRRVKILLERRAERRKRTAQRKRQESLESGAQAYDGQTSTTVSDTGTWIMPLPPPIRNPDETYFLSMTLASVDILCTVPAASVILYFDVQDMQPWLGWDDTHSGYSNIDQFPSIIWRADKSGEVSIEINRWIPILCALLSFALFGLDKASRRMYSRRINWLMRTLGFRNETSGIEASTSTINSTLVFPAVAPELKVDVTFYIGNSAHPQSRALPPGQVLGRTP